MFANVQISCDYNLIEQISITIFRRLQTAFLASRK